MKRGRIPTLRIINEGEDFDGIVAAQYVRCIRTVAQQFGGAVVAMGAEDVLAGARKRLAEQYSRDVPWDSVVVFQTCERMCGSEATEAVADRLWTELLQPLEVPRGNLHRIRGDASDAISEVRRYEELLSSRKLENREGDLFDLVLLGLEADGGVAGLRAEAEGVLSARRHVVACHLSPSGMRGFSLTPIALNRSARIWIVARGSHLAGTVHDTLEGDIEPLKFPLQALWPRGGEMVWFLDTGAAQRLGVLAKDARPL